MKLSKRSIAMVLVLIVAALGLSACSESSSKAARDDEKPATVQPIKGTDKSSVTLSEQAAKRLGIRTALVHQRGSKEVIPYSAVLYSADGKTFAYTSPKPLVFVRDSITVERIARGKAILSRGPATGTAVVTVGSQELFGSEYEVEED
jgi:hypothetical protein